MSWQVQSLKSSKQKGDYCAAFAICNIRLFWTPFLDKQLNYDSGLCWQAYKENVGTCWKWVWVHEYLVRTTFTYLLSFWCFFFIFHPTDFWFIDLGCWIADSLGKSSSFSHCHHHLPYCHLYHRGGQQCCHNDNLFAHSGPLGMLQFQYM